MADKYGNQIVIKKIKKIKHGGHHGGAWKIAYADFVTAMMSFFLLLWLISALSDKELVSIAQYFTPTTGLFGQMGIGFHGGTQLDKIGTKKEIQSSPSIVLGAPTKGAVIDMPKAVDNDKDVDLKNFTSLEKDLYKAIHENPELKEFSENILIEQTPEGLRIQILDDQKKSMFKAGSAELMPYMEKILLEIGKMIKYMPNYLSIDGHTAAVNGASGETWLLSAERAEATRKFLVNNIIDPEQVFRIVGMGDQEPLNKEKLDAPENMRISIILLKNSIVPFQKKTMPDNISLDENEDQTIDPNKKY